MTTPQVPPIEVDKIADEFVGLFGGDPADVAALIEMVMNLSCVAALQGVLASIADSEPETSFADLMLGWRLQARQHLANADASASVMAMNAFVRAGMPGL